MKHSETLGDFIALNEEARRRGTSYGKFVASTTAGERAEIVIKYHKAKERKAKRKAR